MSYQTDAYALAAKKLGWRYSSAHDGFICERYRNRPNQDPDSWGSYEVEPDAEQACFRDGIETPNQAFDYVNDDLCALASNPTK